MTFILPSKSNITVEESSYRSAISESTITKFGASLNFVNDRQFDKHSWHLNGVYDTSVLIAGPDGVYPCLSDMELTGFAYYSEVTGTSGQTIFDVKKLNPNGVNQGSIFSTTPKINTTALDGATTIHDNLNSNTISLPLGHTLGVLNQTLFNAGDVLRFDLLQSSFSPQN